MHQAQHALGCPWRPSQSSMTMSGSCTRPVIGRKQTISRRSNPAKLKELQQIFLLEGAKYNVFPLDDRRVERFNSDFAGRPDLTGRPHDDDALSRHEPHERKHRSQHQEQVARRHRAVHVPDGKASGAIIVQGGRFGGWCLYLKDGVPAHCYNFFGLNTPTRAGSSRSRRESTRCATSSIMTAAVSAKAASARCSLTAKRSGKRARHDRAVRILRRRFDRHRHGHGAPVTEDYETPHGRFTGEIAWARIEIGNEAFSDPAGMEEALAARS